MLRRKATEGDGQSQDHSSASVPADGSIAQEADLNGERRRFQQLIFPKLRKIALSCGRYGLCCLACVLVAVLFVLHGHHITCLMHNALCTPFRQYVVRFPMLPVRPDPQLSLSSTRTPLSCEAYEKFLGEHDKAPKQMLLLIGESRGGSTYTYDTLNLHPDIQMVGHEALFTFSNNVCNNNEQLLRNRQECNFENWLETLYKNAYNRMQGSLQLVGTKVNIEQIPPEFYQELASYLSCIRDSVVILHVTRASAIASFFNYQAEVPERIHAANFDFDSNNLPKGLERPLELDPELAANWVHNRDGLSYDLFRTLGFNSPLPLRYQRVYYEHLNDPVVGDDYWRSVFAFLRVDSSLSVAEFRKAGPRPGGKLRTYNKTHASALCYQRIANWQDVKEALGPESLSSVACEGYAR